MPAVEEAHDVLLRFRQRKQRFSHGEGNGGILFPVQDEDRCGDFSDTLVGAELNFISRRTGMYQ